MPTSLGSETVHTQRCVLVLQYTQGYGTRPASIDSDEGRPLQACFISLASQILVVWKTMLFRPEKQRKKDILQNKASVWHEWIFSLGPLAVNKLLLLFYNHPIKIILSPSLSLTHTHSLSLSLTHTHTHTHTHIHTHTLYLSLSLTYTCTNSLTP